MARRQWDCMLRQIRSVAAVRAEESARDAELLGQFISSRDETAFEVLLRRHGPMVLRVARRVLASEADAEDVFQATFLLLVRRASAIRKRESVASWLHGVAHRLALSVRAQRARRRDKEQWAAETRLVETPAESSWGELEGALHEAIARLPAKYRTPLVCCYLQGRTQEDVARDLGAPLGTVRSWIARGREMLRKQLLRRGISLSVEGAGAALLASACARAEAVPPALLRSTREAASCMNARGDALAHLSPQVVSLLRKATAALLVAKIKSGAVGLLVLVLLVAGMGWAAHKKPGAEQPTSEEVRPKLVATEERSRADAHGDPLPPGAVARFGTIRFRHEGWISWQFAVAPDSRTVAAAAGRSLILWEMATGRPLRRFPFTQEVRCLAFAPDGKSVAVGGEDGIVLRIDLPSGTESRRFVGHQAVRDRFGTHKAIWGVAFTSDGKKLVTWGSDKTVRVWDAASGKELRQFGSKEFGGKDWLVRGLSPDGKFLALLNLELSRALLLWDLEMGKEVRRRTHPDAVGGVAFSPDSTVLAVAYGSQIQPGRIALWDVASGKELRASPGEMLSPGALAFSPDGKTLASTGFGRSLRFWDAGSMKELRAAPSLDVAAFELAFSPDGKTLISRGNENHIRIWDVASGKERPSAEGPSRWIQALAYSPKGKLVASISGGKIWLWSASTGKVVRKLESDGYYFSTVAFSADGKKLASADQDGTLRFWDPETGNESRCIRTGRGQVQHMALSRDGETIAA